MNTLEANSFLVLSAMRFLLIFLRQKLLVLILSSTVGFSALAQDEVDKKSNFSFSGFLDVYYGYALDEQMSGDRLPFLYNHTRRNRLAINLALLNATYESDRIRANLGIQQGTYSQDNYSGEPKALRWIYEANVGYALNPEKSIWLDAGVLPSHIGFESAISTENLTLSRSIIAENSPYFETGFRLSWQQNDRWYFALLYLNGWQRIQSIPGKNKPSFGTQATFSPTKILRLNWSTFLGTDQSNEAGTMLYFSNFYGDIALGKNWSLIAGLDVGTRTLETESARSWWGTSVILQQQFSQRFATAVRYEYYHDPFQAMAKSNVSEGIQTSGLSINSDLSFGKSVLLRLEARWLNAPSRFNLGIFSGNNSNFVLLGSIAWRWNNNTSN